MALASQTQNDFGGGIARGRRPLPNSVYDAVNALVSDDGTLAKRGGSAYYSDSNAGNTLLQVYDEFLQAGQRTVAFSATHLYALNGTTPVDVSSAVGPSGARGVGIGGLLVVPGPLQPTFYAGSLKTAAYLAGTVTVTNGSKTVTGAGTLWSANVDDGMLLRVGSDSGIGIVASVDSNTQITLRDGWSGATDAGAGYVLNSVSLPTEFSGSVIPQHVAAVGTPPRLIVTVGNRAYFTGRGTPTTINITTDYHELPQNAQINGAIGVGDACMVFTAAGLYVISNMSLDDVDAFGNLQHVVSQVNQNLTLWGDAGLVGGDGSVIVPAIDDVFVASLNGEATPISASADGSGGWLEKIRPLYRSYVAAGYRPGLASVHRGHYLLPVLNGTTLVDVLVCRLDRGAAWTRWSGHAAGNAYVVRSGTAGVAPKLLGISGQRITNLAGVFDPVAGNASDADATVADLVITTRDYPTGQQPGFFKTARARYELEDDGSGGTAAPTVAIAFTSDADAGTFTTLTDRGEQGGAAGWGVSAGDKYQWATVGKARERGRLRITVSGACARFVLRSVELLIRQSGKQ